MMKKQWTRFTRMLLAVPVALLLTTACSDTPRPVDVKGFVHYNDTIPLPEDAVLTVELVDLTDMEHITVVKEQEIPLPAVIPATFRIEVMPEEIDEERLYGVQARITGGEEILMITTETYPVLTKGHSDSVSVEVFALEDALDIEYRGILDLRDGILVFMTCGSEYPYLVKSDPLLYEQMEQKYEKILADNPSGVFLHADAHIEENLGPDAVDEFDSTIVVTRIFELRERMPSDCME